MATQTVILDKDILQSLSLTSERLEAAGLRTGTPVTVEVEQGKITLRPVSVDDQLASLDELVGLSASTPGLVEELQRERRHHQW